MEKNILREHALTHVWAEPLQDRQYRVIPSRVSPQLGFYKTATVMWEGFPLPGAPDPMDKRTFHVYPIGQIPPHFFRLKMKMGEWYRVDQLVEETNSTIDIILENGTIAPTVQCYLYQNLDQNFILAVERSTVDYGKDQREGSYGEVDTVPYSLDHRPLMIRFYTNAVQDSKAWRGEKEDPIHSIRSVFQKVNTAADLVGFKAKVKAITDQYPDGGFGNYFIDGFYVEAPTSFKEEHKGKLFSFRFDSTFRERLYFPLRKLPGFVSKKDPRTNKYLIVAPTNYGKIDYCDDLDFYLTYRTASGVKGVMLDRFKANTVRQVTHNAWSVREDVVLALSKQHDFLANVDLLEIMVVIRNGGMQHGLGFQKNRIEDLYHLKQDEIISAMADVNSNLDIWKAAELENSDYIAVMSSNSNKITQEMIENAYGYNAATKAVGRCFYKVEDPTKVFIDPLFTLSNEQSIPDGDTSRNPRSLFWYDKNGKMLSMESSNSTFSSVPVPTALVGNAAYLEVIQGQLSVGRLHAGIYRDKAIVPDKYYGYYGHRCYVCNIVNGVIDNNWTDTTNGPYYIVEPATATKPPQIKWNYTLLAQANLYPLTRIASTVNVIENIIDPNNSNGFIELPLFVMDETSVFPMGVAPGHVDVFVDGTPLIQDLDFKYVKGGIVVITRQIPSKEPVKILTRFYGYMNPETKAPFGPRDIGFIKNGVVSLNNKFNVYHDRDISVNIGGRRFAPDEVQFAEDGYSSGDYLDGAPYSVDEYQALVEPFTSKRTVDFQMEAMKIDQDVSDYLTPRLPEHKPSGQYIEGQHWRLHSPIMATFIEMMVKGLLNDNVIKQWSTDESLYNQTLPIVTRFEKVDPAVIGYNGDYVGVYPIAFKDRIVQVTSLQYQTLERINRMHLNSVLDLTHSVEIKNS